MSDIIIRNANISDAREISRMFYNLEVLHHRFDKTSSFETLSEAWTYIDGVLNKPGVDVKVVEANGKICGYYVGITRKLGNRIIRIGRTGAAESSDGVCIHDIMMLIMMDLYFGKHYDVCIAHNVYKINKGIVNMYLNELGFKILKTYKECSREKYVVVKYNK